MRNSPKVEIIENDGEMIGISLEADFTAEHEWGIKDLKDKFNFNTKTIEEYVDDAFNQSAIDKIKNVLGYTQNIPTDIGLNNDSKILSLIENKGMYYLTSFYEDRIEYFDRAIYQDKDELSGAWDGQDFVVKTNSKKEAEFLFTLIQAELENDLFIGSIEGFLSQGLMILIGSKIPDNIREDYKNKSEEAIRLYTAAKESGIKEIVDASDKKYFALSPRFKKEDDGTETLAFWLNPYEQRTYNAGLYTVEELLDWTKNEGPIMSKG